MAYFFALPGEAKTPPPSKLALMLAFTVLVVSPPDLAEARHRHRIGGSCPSGMIKRLSLGVCVSKRSRAARGFVERAHLRRAPGRHLSHHRYAAKHVDVGVPEAESPPVEKSQDRIERSRKSDKNPASEVDTTELPVGIPGSLLMRPPVVMKFDWGNPPGGL